MKNSGNNDVTRYDYDAEFWRTALATSSASFRAQGKNSGSNADNPIAYLNDGALSCLSISAAPNLSCPTNGMVAP